MTSYIDSLLGEREKIVHTARQHWFILASSITFEIIAIFVIFAGTVFASTNYTHLVFWIILLGFILMLIPLITMTRDILNWTHRQFIVTNRRVMQISGIINKNVNDSSLDKVNDVKMTQSVLGRLFNFGDIEILTASELGVNMFRRIGKPIRFKTAMLNAKEQMSHLETYAKPQEDIPALISQLDQLRQQGIVSEEEFQAKKSDLLAKL